MSRKTFFSTLQMSAMLCQSESIRVITPIAVNTFSASWKQRKFTQVYCRRGLGFLELFPYTVRLCGISGFHHIPQAHQILLHMQHSLASPWQAYLSEGQEGQSLCCLITAPCKRAQQLSLYQAPAVKRVWAYKNGGRPDSGTYAWASAISEVSLMWILNRPRTRPWLWRL